MFVLHKALNGRHLTTTFCQWVDYRKRRRLSEEEAREGADAEITAYGIPIAPVTYFNYIKIVLAAADNDWPELVSNLQRACQKWSRLTRVLIRKGADHRTLGQIYLAVFQSVILYGSETWFMNPCIGRVLGRFHHRVARRITGSQTRQ